MLSSDLPMFLLEPEAFDCSHFHKNSERGCRPSAAAAVAKPTPAWSELHSLVATACLNNPFWADLRILHFFEKQGICMTLDTLNRLRTEVGLGDKKALAAVLLQNHVQNGTALTQQQLRFVERINPAFRDRDISPARPGEQLLYSCLLVRRLKRSKGIGMLYLHLFLDLFNGYVVGRFSPTRSVTVGVNLLQKNIGPTYDINGCPVQNILHSTLIAKDIEECKTLGLPKATSCPSLQWSHTSRIFGTLLGFQQMFTNKFFERLESIGLPFFLLQPSFDQWLQKYNASQDFFARRDLLHYMD